jgi:glycosyltransferase involved in cell wall biosynthesis
MKKRIRLMVNAIPLRNIRTGIGRYLKCLYTSLETLYGSRLEVRYFDGRTALHRFPDEPRDLSRWSSMTDLFWRLPLPPAVLLRMAMQIQREVAFRRAARGSDIYHEPGFFPFLPPGNCRTVFTVHDLSLLRVPHFHPPERVSFSRLFFKSRCRTVDHFLTVSEFTRKELEALLGPLDKRVTVTRLAHESSVFYQRNPDQVGGVREVFGLPEKYLLFVGAGDPRKNLDLIPQALTVSGLRMPVAIVGWPGWSKVRGADDRLIFLGYVSDDVLAGLYSGAQALVFPSLYEGFGLPVLEAMACGCPVICSDSTSLPEVAGDAALFLEDPHDGQALALLLRALVESPSLRRELSQKGQDQAARFSWERTAATTFKVFEDLL